MSASSATPGGGPDHDQQPIPLFMSIDAEMLSKLQEEITLEISAGFDAAAAQQRLAAAQAARAKAPDSEIRQAGVQVTESTISSIVNDDSPSPRKKFRMADMSLALVKKVYKGNIGTTEPMDDESEEDDKQEEKQDENHDENEDDDEWLQLFDGQFDQLPLAYQERLREYFTNQAKLHRKLDAMHQGGKTDLDEHDDHNGHNSKDHHAEAKTPQFDLLGSLCSRIEYAVEIGKHLRPKDILSLYSVSCDFHNSINGFLTSSMRTWTDTMAPTGARIFPFNIYKGTSILDPAGRLDDPALYHSNTHLAAKAPVGVDPGECKPKVTKVTADSPKLPPRVRYVPNLAWLQMIVAREKRVRDILAVLARAGHRTPPETHEVVKKLWLVMDMASNYQRQLLMKNHKFFSDDDLYIAQLFFLKLSLRFNDPIFGNGTQDMMRTLMGQRTGFTPLWMFLRGKGYNTLREMVQIQIRYNLRLTSNQAETALPIFGVPIELVGIGHLEGWGIGSRHLLRIDELVICESTRRQMDMSFHLEAMLAYGSVDVTTGDSLAPTLEEMYMSDDELDDVAPDVERGIHGGCGNVPFRFRDWTPKVARKANWDSLTEEEQCAILVEDRDEIRVAEAWDDNSEFDYEPYQDDFEIGGDNASVTPSPTPSTVSSILPSAATSAVPYADTSASSLDNSAFSAMPADQSTSTIDPLTGLDLALLPDFGPFDLDHELGFDDPVANLDFGGLSLNPSHTLYDNPPNTPVSEMDVDVDDVVQSSFGEGDATANPNAGSGTGSTAATASGAVSGASDGSNSEDDKLKALADQEYSDHELTFDWELLLAQAQEMANQAAETPFDADVDWDDIEVLKNYVRQY